MKKFLFFLTMISLVLGACTQKAPSGFILVKGGTFTHNNSNFYGKNISLSDFYISKYEVTQKEWKDVMGNNPSEMRGDSLPVAMVSWYNCIEYCNKKSIKEGLKPYYNIDKTIVDPNNKKDPNFDNELDNVKWTVTINENANGYRLPTEAEWEYSADGGILSKNYIYCGSNELDKIAWYWKNSGDSILNGYWSWPVLEKNHNRIKPVGIKKPNELGIYDMSGNVREWCWDWYSDTVTRGSNPKGSSSGSARVWKGGGWIGADFCCEPSFRGNLAANGLGPDQGFRLCRNK